MAQKRPPRRALLTMAGLLLTAPALAQQPSSFELSGELSVGGMADSDVGIADLDQSTRQGDIASLLGAKLEATFRPASRVTLRGGYELNDTRYQDFSEFNLQTHRLSADAELELGATRTGVLYNYVDARLDGEEYLGFQQVSPYVSHLFGNTLMLRGAYARSERDFNIDPQRDSTSDEVQLDAFFLLDGTKRYVSVGAKGGRTDAGDETLSYDNAAVKGRYIHTTDIMGRDVKLRAGADFERRDYQAPLPVVEEARRDETLGANTGVIIPVTGPVSIDAGYEFRRRSSNLADADYEEHLGTLQLKVAF